MLKHFFTTPVSRTATELTAEQLAELRGYVLELRQLSPGENRSNRGGWHSAGNLFEAGHRQSSFLTSAISSALFGFIGEVFGYRGEIQLTLTGWAVVNGPGDYNVPHTHAANLLSGALCISIPPGMRDGEIIFQAPRLNLDAHQTEGMRRLKITPPWHRNSIPITPVAGEILVFPSWVMHYVVPFKHEDAAAQRIVISFNASV